MTAEEGLDSAILGRGGRENARGSGMLSKVERDKELQVCLVEKNGNIRNNHQEEDLEQEQEQPLRGNKQEEENDDNENQGNGVDNQHNNNHNNNKGEKKKEMQISKRMMQSQQKKLKQEEKHYLMIRETFEEAKQVIADTIVNGERLDIYQYCAFLSKHSYYVAPKSKAVLQRNNTYDNNNNNKPCSLILYSTDRLRKAVDRRYRVRKRMYYVAVGKAFLVAILQLTSLLVGMSELIGRSEYTRDNICSNTFEFRTAHQTIKKTIFAGFCALVAINASTMIDDVGKSGFYATLYKNHCILPDLIDQGWLIAGRTINYFVLISSTWASFLIIFFSSDVLDMVINSVAIFFVLQLDNMVIGRKHYKVIGHYLNAYEWEIEMRVAAYIRREKKQITEEERRNKQREWNIFKLLFDFLTRILGSAVVSPAVFLTSILAFIVVPGFILVCGE